MRLSSCVSSSVLETDEFDGIMTPPYGMTLGQVGDLLSCYLPAGDGWEVKEVTAEIGLEEFGNEVRKMGVGARSERRESRSDEALPTPPPFLMPLSLSRHSWRSASTKKVWSAGGS